jgi:hypothetical protein
MEKLLENISTCKFIYSYGNHKVFSIPFNCVDPILKKWSKNRDPDENRVNEMVKFVEEGGHIIDQCLYLAELPDEGLVCYDGNHRKEVFRKLNYQNIILINVLFNSSQNQVLECFKKINLAVQVPTIYFENDEKSFYMIKTEINKIVKEYMEKYKKFSKSGNKYNVPNFNRDHFEENLYNIYKETLIPVQEIKVLLEELNKNYSEGILIDHKSYKERVIEKCRKHNFWIFINKTISVDHIKKLNK